MPTASYHGSDVFSYQVCDVAVPPKCASANVTVSVTARGPTAVDDSARTQYATGVTVAVLANDIAGAEPLQGSSVTIVSGPSSNNGASVTINAADGSIEYKPAAGFVGSDSFTYQVCDSSTPVALCSSSSVTIVVQPRAGAGIQYRLVEIDYDILGKAIAATVQTRTVAAAKVGNVELDMANSTGLSAVLSGPELSPGCAASSPAGWCDQFHKIRFSDEPCLVSKAEMKLKVQFQCADGGAPNTCGYQNVQSALSAGSAVLVVRRVSACCGVRNQLGGVVFAAARRRGAGCGRCQLRQCRERRCMGGARCSRRLERRSRR